MFLLMASTVSFHFDSFIARIDPYHSAAMLSLVGIKSFVLTRQASPRREFSARLAM